MTEYMCMLCTCEYSDEVEERPFTLNTFILLHSKRNHSVNCICVNQYYTTSCTGHMQFKQCTPQLASHVHVHNIMLILNAVYYREDIGLLVLIVCVHKNNERLILVTVLLFKLQTTLTWHIKLNTQHSRPPPWGSCSLTVSSAGS